MSSDFKPILKVSDATKSPDNKYEKIKELKKKKSLLFKEAYYKSVKSLDIKKAALSGMKYVAYFDLNTKTTYGELYVLMQDIYDIQLVLSCLTPKEFEQIFPIIKDYEGHKYESKDYWTTKEYLKTIPQDKRIGKNIDEFLWNYYNNDVINFSVKMYLCVDRIRKLRGEKSMMQEFADMYGVDTYTLDKEHNVMMNNTTGEVFKLEDPPDTTVKEINKDSKNSF